MLTPCRAKNVRSSSSMDSGVGHELGNNYDSQGTDSDQSDLGALPGNDKLF